MKKDIVAGLGEIGLPILKILSKKENIVGYDLNEKLMDEKKFNTEDIYFIESEFNDLMLENDFEDLFNFQKFKVFLKSARDEND